MRVEWATVIFLFQAEDGIRDLVRSRGLGDVYKRQAEQRRFAGAVATDQADLFTGIEGDIGAVEQHLGACLLYTSDAADERSSVDLGGRRIIKKKTKTTRWWQRAWQLMYETQWSDESYRVKNTIKKIVRRDE